MPKPRKRKVECCTRYGVRFGTQWRGTYGELGSFDNAALYRDRERAGKWQHDGDVIVPIRCRVLSDKRRNPRRTR